MSEGARQQQPTRLDEWFAAMVRLHLHLYGCSIEQFVITLGCLRQAQTFLPPGAYERFGAWVMDRSIE